MHTQRHILVRVVDVELLQKQAIVEEAVVHLCQELEDDAFLRPQEDYSVILIGTGLIVHHDARQTIPELMDTNKIKPTTQLICHIVHQKKNTSDR